LHRSLKRNPMTYQELRMAITCAARPLLIRLLGCAYRKPYLS
jgi:hypothetical protein